MYVIRNKASGRYLADPPDYADGGDGYTDDPAKALRFNRRQFPAMLAAEGEEVVELPAPAPAAAGPLVPARPWRVEYNQRFDTWHPKSMPRVVDAGGGFVVRPPQSEDVCHPGLYDARADATAHAIANAVNAQFERAAPKPVEGPTAEEAAGDAPATPAVRTSDQRAAELMAMPLSRLPDLLRRYCKSVSAEIGWCGEVALTCYAHYAEVVEGLPCGDPDYVATLQARAWFAEHAGGPAAGPTFADARAEVERLVRVDALRRSGVRMGEVSDGTILRHAFDELAELTAAPNDATELADLLGVLVHYAVKRGWAEDVLVRLMLEKFKTRFTED